MSASMMEGFVTCAPIPDVVRAEEVTLKFILNLTWEIQRFDAN